MHVIAAERFVDEVEREASVLPLAADLEKRHGFALARLIIDPLSAGWDSPLQTHHFRSGCGPLEALAAARDLLAEDVDLVVIEGSDPLRSGYAGNPAERARRMGIYGADLPIPEAYTRLAYRFLARQGISVSDFHHFEATLWENYQRTARSRGIPENRPRSGTRQATSLFRAADCAHPVVDFTGRLLLGSEKARRRAPRAAGGGVRVLGVAVEETRGDGPGHIEEIVRYDHLRCAFQAACHEAGVDLVSRFLHGSALMEVYSCFPIVPLAFLLTCGFATSMTEVMALIERHEVTVTGGMNLGKGPWNCAALNALVLMIDRMQAEGVRWGAVHGNGGLGYKQGVVLLGLDRSSGIRLDGGRSEHSDADLER